MVRELLFVMELVDRLMQVANRLDAGKGIPPAFSEHEISELRALHASLMRRIGEMEQRMAEIADGKS